MKTQTAIITLLILVFSALLESCFREDEMIPKHQSGNVISFQVNMGNTYKNQIFYDLGSNSAIAENDKIEWDLGFESAIHGWHIFLNSARFMKITNSHLTDFQAVYDTTGSLWIYDAASGYLDSTAVGLWVDTTKSPLTSFNEVYFLDLGQDADGNPVGFKRIMFESVDSSIYKIRYSDVDGKNEKSAIITKNKNTNFTCFSFKTNNVVEIEPPSTNWDILFSQYSVVLYDENGTPTPYLVMGVLLNRNKVEASFSDSISFDKMDFKSALELKFSSRTDYIGYEWKKYDFKTGTYQVKSNRTYVIKDTEGFLFKLRFTGFYNNSGEKGYPTFEVQML